MHYASTLYFPLRNSALAVKAGPTVHQRQKCLLLMGLMMAFAVGAQTAVAQQGIPNTTPIDKCGTVISAPGHYTVDKVTLESTSPTEDCIAIRSSGVSLAIGESSTVTLIGPGGTGATSAGIRVGKGTTGVQVTFGSDVTIKQFGVGIVVQGSGVSLTELGGGLYTGSFSTTHNAAQGVLISDATNVLIDRLRSESNGGAGLEVDGASGVIVLGTTYLIENSGRGLWVHSSNENQFFYVNAEANTQDGIYLGEEPANAQSKSQYNLFVNEFVGTNYGVGIAIGAGDTHNLVTSTTATNNDIGAGKGHKVDFEDLNGNCIDNSWSKNRFLASGGADPTCILNQ
jgi:Right handed beta helix region